MNVTSVINCLQQMKISRGILWSILVNNRLNALYATDGLTYVVIWFDISVYILATNHGIAKRVERRLQSVAVLKCIHEFILATDHMHVQYVIKSLYQVVVDYSI